MEGQTEKAWDAFAATGRIDAYLRYCSCVKASTQREGETPWASSRQKESSPGKSSTGTPPAF